MGQYLVRRLLSTIPTLFLVSIMVFGIVHLTPGDPVAFMLGDEASAEVIARVREQLGFNQPLPVQYLKWVGNLATGDLGRSLRNNAPVAEALALRLPVSLQLTLYSMLITLSVAIPVGVLAAVRRNSGFDLVASTASLIGVSVPNFVVGFLLIFLLSIKWRVLPPSGYVSVTEDPLMFMKLLFMPALTLGTSAAAIVMRMTRSSLLEVLDQDYIRTARAKGLATRLVIYKHAFKNAMIPVVTVVGLQVGFLLGGAVITEQIFQLPGMGRLVVDSVFMRDYPMMQAVIMVIAVIFVFTNLLVDVLYAYLDPRIKYS